MSCLGKKSKKCFSSLTKARIKIENKQRNVQNFEKMNLVSSEISRFQKHYFGKK
jgi:hypothetical protein